VRPPNVYRADMTSGKGQRAGLHFATIAHDGRIWDAYLEFDDDAHRPDIYRARIRFDPANSIDFADPNPRTTVIIIEESYEAAVVKARRFDERALEAMLRSALPEPNSSDD